MSFIYTGKCVECKEFKRATLDEPLSPDTGTVSIICRKCYRRLWNEMMDATFLEALKERQEEED